MRLYSLVLLLASLSLFATENRDSVQEQRMGYHETTPWERKSGKGYDGYYRVAPKNEKGKPVKRAEWTVDLPAVGRKYAIYATWVADEGNSPFAPYEVFDGDKPLGSVQVDQRRAPRGTTINGTTFQRLGSFVFSSRVIKIILTSQSDGTVVSDSVLAQPE